MVATVKESGTTGHDVTASPNAIVDTHRGIEEMEATTIGERWPKNGHRRAYPGSAMSVGPPAATAQVPVWSMLSHVFRPWMSAARTLYLEPRSHGA
jgi:hypothetical protein